LTEKDLVDLTLALELEVDWVGLSFVRSVKDIEQLRQLITAANSHAGIVSKIEKPEAVADIDAIIAATDAVMVARGDLGVEVPMESVPLIQKMIIKKSILHAKPVIVATQMMESMMDSLTPSRAEVNDVANAVLDGADAVMLSGETSVGQYPVEVVQAIAKIILSSESISEKVKGAKRPKLNDERLVNKTLCYHGVRVADQVDARAICAMTFSGYSAQLVSSHRPQAAIYAFTAKRSILNKLSLHWGLKGFFYDGMQSTDETFKEISQALKVGGLVDKGDFIVQLASMPIEARGTTNTLRVSEVK
jgi:pyruvate kinase